ncbi:MAG: hypothetical protein WC485_11115 [Opitutaceae bacterium]
MLIAILRQKIFAESVDLEFHVLALKPSRQRWEAFGMHTRLAQPASGMPN